MLKPGDIISFKSRTGIGHRKKRYVVRRTAEDGHIVVTYRDLSTHITYGGYFPHWVFVKHLPGGKVEAQHNQLKSAELQEEFKDLFV